MSKNLEQLEKVYQILQDYKGTNPYIIGLKNGVFAYKNLQLNDFHCEYILTNYDKEPIALGKTIKIEKWFGEKKQKEWNLEFTPEKLLVHYFFGETENFYHMAVQYRRSQTKLEYVFIPKNVIITPLFEKDFLSMDIDFSKYNSDTFKLKPHQERSIKFLASRKKGILSLEMGLGKTTCAIVAALEMKYKKILVICPASLKTQWANEIARFDNRDNITIVEGSNWKENKFTIINYDILRKFHTVATETKKFTKKIYNDDGSIDYEKVEKVVKTQKADIVKECLTNSQLYQANFDLIIIDEAHRLSNKDNTMYQIIDDLIKRTKIDSIYCLTGTMVKNNPMNLFNVLKIVGCDLCKDYASYVNYMKKYCGAKSVYANKKERDYYTNIFLKQHNAISWYELNYDEKNELNDFLAKKCKKIMIPNEPTNIEELAERIKPIYYCETNAELRESVKIDKQLLEYSLSTIEQQEYDNAWDSYLSSSSEKNIDKLIENHKLIEGSIFRQYLANLMVNKSISLAEKEIKKGKKIIIFCSFDKELYDLQEHFGDSCVIYNGKMTAKKKDEAVNTFKTNDNVKVFIGNLQSASVGLNLNEASVIIFNSVSFVPSDNEQAEFRCLRLGQDKDVTIYYQKFKNTYQDRLFEILNNKKELINKIVIEEKNK